MMKNFFTEWTSEMSYILGFFAADGNLSINKRGGCYFSFHSKDKQIIFDIKKVLKVKNKISQRIDRVSDGVFYRLQIGSKDIVNTLQTIGFRPRKTEHIPFPNIPESMVCHFVRGYFDGDGNIWQGEVHKERKTKHKVLQLAFTSGASEFLKNLKLSLEKILGTNGSYVISKNGTYSRLQYSTKDALKIYNFMYNTNTSFLYLKRKKDQFDIHIKNMRM